jgi:hypothetical protein
MRLRVFSFRSLAERRIRFFGALALFLQSPAYRAAKRQKNAANGGRS